MNWTDSTAWACWWVAVEVAAQRRVAAARARLVATLAPALAAELGLEVEVGSECAWDVVWALAVAAWPWPAVAAMSECWLVAAWRLRASAWRLQAVAWRSRVVAGSVQEWAAALWAWVRGHSGRRWLRTHPR